MTSMSQRIRALAVRPTRLTPTEAELMIDLHCSELHATSELRGRLTGPTCLYSTTIEIAHPVKAQSRERGQPILHGRVVIPEPAWWDAESPFLYHGPIELWEHESRVESVGLRLGLRHAEWKGEQLFWNGKQVAVKSQTLSEIDESTLHSLRERGFNSVIIPPAQAKIAWPIADRIGLYVFSAAPFESGGLQHPSAAPTPQ
jgi:beta-galactosidase/beta-glucuronidase